MEYIGKNIKNDIKFSISEAVDIFNFLEFKSILFDYNFIKFDTRSSSSIEYLASVDRDYFDKTIKCLPPNQVKSIAERLLNKFGLVI